MTPEQFEIQCEYLERIAEALETIATALKSMDENYIVVEGMK